MCVCVFYYLWLNSNLLINSGIHCSTVCIKYSCHTVFVKPSYKYSVNITIKWIYERLFLINSRQERKSLPQNLTSEENDRRLLYLLSVLRCRIRESKNAEKRGVDVDPAIIRISTFKRLDPTFVNSDNLSSSRTFTREASVFSESFSLSVRLYPWSYKKEMNNINLFYQTLLACIYKKSNISRIAALAHCYSPRYTDDEFQIQLLSSLHQ